MSSIFDGVKFLDESCESSPTYDVICESYRYIQDCSIFITEEMIADCMGIKSLIEQSALLEGAKFDAWLNQAYNGSDKYQKLRKDLKEIIAANNLPDDVILKNSTKLWRLCKRIVTMFVGLVGSGLAGGAAASGVGTAFVSVAGAAGFIPGYIIGVGLAIVVGFIAGKLILKIDDAIMLSDAKKDCKIVIDQLHKGAASTKNESLARRMNKDADRIEAALKRKSLKIK